MSTGEFKKSNDGTTKIFETADTTIPTRDSLKGEAGNNFPLNDSRFRNNRIFQLHKKDLRKSRDIEKIQRAFGVLSEVIDAVPDDSLNNKDAFAEAVVRSLRDKLKRTMPKERQTLGFSPNINDWTDEDIDTYVTGPSICLWIDAAFDTAVSELPPDERAKINVDELRKKYADRIFEEM